jgi:hypothetical protein
MKQVRLEVLKLAVAVSQDDPYKAVHLAAEYENYIENGVKVVELSPPSTLHLKPKKSKK